MLSAKLSSKIYLIRGLTWMVSRSVLLTAYHGCFGSNMSYGVLNWGHSGHTRKIFGLQRRCIRVIAGLGSRECCLHDFVDLGILTFPCVYILHCLTYLKQNFPLFTAYNLQHNYLTRNNINIIPDFHRIARARRGTDYWCVRFLNVLPVAFREQNLCSFTSKLKKYFKAKAFYSLEEYLNNNFNDLL